MKKTKIIVPALAVLLLSTAASVSGTVAWFSMNTAIKVDGMSVKTKVGSNLQIAQTNLEANYSNADLTQSRAGILEPASTVDAANFYYTTNANAFGDANADAYTTYNEDTAFANALANKDNYDNDFNEAYGFAEAPAAAAANATINETVCYGYIDYSFYLKTYFSSSGENICLSKCNMLYNNGVVDSGYSWRVALFSNPVNENTEQVDSATVAASGSLKSILDFESSKNWNEVTRTLLANEASTSGYFADPLLTQEPTGATADGKTYYYQASGQNTTPNAVSATNTAPTAVSQANVAAKVATSTAAGNARYKVVVRLWLEGEDVSCTVDTFAALTNLWTLDLEFKVGKNGENDHTYDGVQYIGSVASA